MSKIHSLTKRAAIEASSTPAHTRSRRAAFAPRLLLSIVTLWFASVGSISAQSPNEEFRVLPDTPRALQAVYVRLTLSACQGIAEVKHANGIFSIGVTSQVFCIPSPVPRALEVSLGKLPQGQYRVRVANADDPNDPESWPELTFDVAAPAPGRFSDEFGPLLDYSGVWSSPDYRGQGWFVEHRSPDRLLLTWVTYDDAGRNTWYVMQANLRSYEVLSGPVFKTQRTGTTVELTQIGSGRFESRAADEAEFTLLLDGAEVPTTINLRRAAL